MMYVGLDAHKDSTAVSVAGSEPGAKARFVGTIGPELSGFIWSSARQVEVPA